MTGEQKGETLEETYDWYAQDSHGNLWYLGEDTAEYENGKLKTKEGSWASGVDGAEPGVVVPASPKQGMKLPRGVLRRPRRGRRGGPERRTARCRCRSGGSGTRC